MISRSEPKDYMQRSKLRKSCSRCELFASLLLLVAGMICKPAFGASPVIVTLPANSSGAEIQKALDGLPPNGEVVLSAGTYEISQPLLLRHDYETLRGSGPATILHLADGADCPVVILGPPMTKTQRPAAHLRLADLLIDGNRKNQKVELWRIAGDGSEFNNNGVQIWHVTDAAVEHVVCCRCRSGGLVTASVRRLQVNDLDAYDNQFDGLACYQTEDSRFDGLRLHDNLGAGMSLDLAFNHNFITNAVLAGNDLGIFMRDSRNNSFQGLTISKSHHDGVYMAQAAIPTAKGWRLCPDTQCIGNNFQSLVVHDCGGKAFQVNDASCTNNVIFGASFLRNIRGGLGQPATNPVSFHEAAER
jgi:parallel beta-helix repeat protein